MDGFLLYIAGKKTLAESFFRVDKRCLYLHDRHPSGLGFRTSLVKVLCLLLVHKCHCGDHDIGFSVTAELTPAAGSFGCTVAVVTHIFPL